MDERGLPLPHAPHIATLSILKPLLSHVAKNLRLAGM